MKFLQLQSGPPLDEMSIACILRDLLHAIEYLHTEGKIHRDIKGFSLWAPTFLFGQAVFNVLCGDRALSLIAVWIALLSNIFWLHIQLKLNLTLKIGSVTYFLLHFMQRPTFY